MSSPVHAERLARVRAELAARGLDVTVLERAATAEALLLEKLGSYRQR